jgi:hypothetical protein
MNRAVAYSLLTIELDKYRRLGHAELVGLVNDETSMTQRGSDGLDYSITIWVRWHDRDTRDIAVSGAVGSADWASPHDRLDESFVVSSDSTMA